MEPEQSETWEVPTGTPEEIAAARAAAVQEAANAVLQNGEIYAAPTPYGEVHICRVTSGAEGSATWVDVFLQGATEGGDPHFRIFNPPMLAADPGGPVEINGQRFREDPLLAVAQVVAENGGARSTKRRPR